MAYFVTFEYILVCALVPNVQCDLYRWSTKKIIKNGRLPDFGRRFDGIVFCEAGGFSG